MSIESKYWYSKTNELERDFPKSEVPYNIACSYIKKVIRYIDKETNIKPYMSFPKNDTSKKYPKMKKASNRRKYCYLYILRGSDNAWQIQTKGYRGIGRYWSGWHNIVHAMSHRIIRNHTAEHSVLEYKLTKFVFDWGYADKHKQLEKGN